MGDVTIHLLLDSTLRFDAAIEGNDDDDDGEEPFFRFHVLSRVLSADSSLSELMGVVLSEINVDVVVAGAAAEGGGWQEDGAGERIRPTSEETTSSGRRGSSESRGVKRRRASLGDLVFVDASYHPHRDITSIVRAHPKDAGPCCATLQSLGWYPSGRLVVLPMPPPSPLAINYCGEDDASRKIASLVSRFVKWSSRNTHFRDVFDYNDPNTANGWRRSLGPSSAADAVNIVRSTWTGTADGESDTMTPSEMIDAVMAGRSNSRRSEGDEEEVAMEEEGGGSEASVERAAMDVRLGRYILLLGVDEDLFTLMFEVDETWPCELRTMGDTHTTEEIFAALNDPNILCCVFSDYDDAHWKFARDHYGKGGFVVCFAAEGVFNAPAKLSKIFDLEWSYSAYTKHEHRLTSIGMQYLGDAITEQQYTKSNMLSVPEGDRIVIGKIVTLDEYLSDYVDVSIDVVDMDDDDRIEYETARDVGYPEHCREMENHASLAMHAHPVHGGRIAYLGFVNSDGNIPKIVRALLTGVKNHKTGLDPALAIVSDDNADKTIERAMSLAARARHAPDLDEEERVKYRHIALAELECVTGMDDPRIRIKTLASRGEILNLLGYHADAIETFSEIISLVEEGFEAKAEGDYLMQQLNEVIAMGTEKTENLADAIVEMMDAISKKAEYASLESAAIKARLEIDTMIESGDWANRPSNYSTATDDGDNDDEDDLPSLVDIAAECGEADEEDEKGVSMKEELGEYEASFERAGIEVRQGRIAVKSEDWATDDDDDLPPLDDIPLESEDWATDDDDDLPPLDDIASEYEDLEEENEDKSMAMGEEDGGKARKNRNKYSEFPRVYNDEYGRALCSAHRRQECHICCLSFTDMNEEIDRNPSDRDVGVFIPESAIVDWHNKMKLRMPAVFPIDEHAFGDDPGQHPYGTKLHFDDHPWKNCTVLGSRWQYEAPRYRHPGICPYPDYREPHYVIYVNRELDQIGFFDAHLNDYRWKVVGWDPKVNPRFDSLASAHQQIQKASSSKEDFERSDEDASDDAETGTLDSVNRRICRTLKRIDKDGEDCPMRPWDLSVNKPFLEQFFMHSFSTSEREHIISFDELVTGGDDYVEEKTRSLPEHLSMYEINFRARLMLAKIVAYHARDNFGGVIICNERRTKFQAIEFNNNHESHDLVPCVGITYATDPEGIEGPTLYLRGETIKRINVSNELAVVLEDHLLNCVSNDGLNDIGGLLFHQGFIAPMKITLGDVSSDDCPDCVTSIMPAVNFGVELEVSCASGNLRQRIALALQHHAQVKVSIQTYIGKGGKGVKGGKGMIGGNIGSGGKGDYIMSGKSTYGKMPLKGSSDESCQANAWRLVYDESIEPNTQNPRSLMFELVSPVLSGIVGLNTLSNTVAVMSDVACVRVNESMGLHVHVEAREKEYSLESMKSICQQFILHERAIDALLPFHRRTGSEKCHSYFESNAHAVMKIHGTLKGSLNAIFSCPTRNDLYDLMNPNIFRQRYHKLNLQNLATGRQPTIEFRQHHSSKDKIEIVAWVQFCVFFVVNAAKLPPLDDFSQIGHVTEDESATFNHLFEEIIKCPTLHNYYSKARLKYAFG